MSTINEMSPAARSAAMRGGMDGWGEIGSAQRNIRYMEARPKRPGRKPKCFCGCAAPKTHLGMANGVCLISGCELLIRRWVRNGQCQKPTTTGEGGE